MKNKQKNTTETDGVEQLLQSAQDEILLKLSVDSHMSRVAPDYLESDLYRRFKALKSKPSDRQLPQSTQNQRREVVNVVDNELRSVLADDLSVRFAALKASLSSPSSSTAESGVRVGPNSANDLVGDGFKSNHLEEDEEEDEVEKVIRWAKDAARLDPSPPSDNDVDVYDDNDNKDSDDENQDSDDEDFYRKKKGMKK